MGKPATLRPMPNHALKVIAASYGMIRREATPGQVRACDDGQTHDHGEPEVHVLGARGEDEPPPPKNRTREEARRRRQADRLDAKRKGTTT